MCVKTSKGADLYLFLVAVVTFKIKTHGADKLVILAVLRPQSAYPVKSILSGVSSSLRITSS